MQSGLAGTYYGCTEQIDEPEYVEGCTDPLANNYNPEADMDDGSCEYDSGGCSGGG